LFCLLVGIGRNFVDPIPTDDNPARVEVGENLARASSTSKNQATTILPGVSAAELYPYVEYVPRLVPRAPRSVSKRARADDASAGVSSTKTPHQSSTRPGTQVVGSMLLGEHINMLSYLLLVYVLNRVLSPFSDGTVVELLEGEEDDDDDVALNTRQ
jgi:hypothetical protein